MRRLILASMLVLASCAPRPQEVSTPVTQAPSRQPLQRSLLTGLTTTDLVTRLGTPSLQIREGSSLKLQFRSRQCVVDAYLYPSADGQMRVTHVDSRDRSGAAADQAACVAGLENPI